MQSKDILKETSKEDQQRIKMRRRKWIRRLQKERRQPLSDGFDMDTGGETERSPKKYLVENRRKKKEKISGGKHGLK